MFNLKIMNSKECKRFYARLEEQYGCDVKVLKKYVLMLNESRKRFYIANEELFDIDIMKFNVDAIGLYIGSQVTNGDIRLTIEGSQLLGPSSTKQVMELNDKEFAAWIRGNTIDIETDERGFVIIKNKNDFCGSGKPVLNERTNTIELHNYIPKTRYVRSED